MDTYRNQIDSTQLIIPAADQDTSQRIKVVVDLSVRRAELMISKFPRTRYYGSKRRLLPWLYNSMKDLRFQSVLDGFGGTACVSLMFKAMGKDVTFNDALESNVLTAKAVLANEIRIGNDEAEHFFQSVVPIKGFIATEFSGKFYLEDENRWLDGVTQSLKTVPDFKRSVFLYSIFQACLQKRPFNLFHRANLNLRTSKVHKSFGNQVTWDTPFPELAFRAFKELKACVWRSACKHTVLVPTDISQLNTGYDLVYLDPPYISLKNGGDDYLRRYHFLEGLSQYERWNEMIDRSYNNLQFVKNPHIAEWQSRNHFQRRLFDLVKKHKSSVVVLSYVDNAYPSKKVLVEFFSETFNKVEVIECQLSHALSKGKRNELLIIGKQE